VDDDWRGLDGEWLQRIVRRLLGDRDQTRSRGGRLPTDGSAFEEFRRFQEATCERRPRPVRWTVELSVPRSVDDDRLSTVGSELGLDRAGERRLDAAELMSLFQEDEPAGLEVVRRLITLGFCRRPCPALGVTDRYYCRAPGDRAELGRQVARWLREA
jgi:hypothetical protein